MGHKRRLTKNIIAVVTHNRYTSSTYMYSPGAVDACPKNLYFFHDKDTRGILSILFAADRTKNRKPIRFWNFNLKKNN